MTFQQESEQSGKWVFTMSYFSTSEILSRHIDTSGGIELHVLANPHTTVSTCVHLVHHTRF